jgi:hypothetical protein
MVTLVAIVEVINTYHPKSQSILYGNIGKRPDPAIGSRKGENI